MVILSAGCIKSRFMVGKKEGVHDDEEYNRRLPAPEYSRNEASFVQPQDLI